MFTQNHGEWFNRSAVKTILNEGLECFTADLFIKKYNQQNMKTETLTNIEGNLWVDSDGFLYIRNNNVFIIVRSAKLTFLDKVKSFFKRRK